MNSQSKGLLSRWYLKIAQFLSDLVLEHKPGKLNEAADALSLAPMLNEESLDGRVLIVSFNLEEQLIQQICDQQSKDQEIVGITDYLEKKLPEDWKVEKRILSVAKKGYFDLDDVLYYKSSDVPAG